MWRLVPFRCAAQGRAGPSRTARHPRPRAPVIRGFLTNAARPDAAAAAEAAAAARATGEGGLMPLCCPKSRPLFILMERFDFINRFY